MAPSISVCLTPILLVANLDNGVGVLLAKLEAEKNVDAYEESV